MRLYFEEITSDEEEEVPDKSTVNDHKHSAKVLSSSLPSLSGQSVDAHRWAFQELAVAGNQTVAPSGRGGATLNNGADNTLLLFGGADRMQKHYGETYRFEIGTRTWKLIDTTGSPPCARSGHSAVSLEEGRFLIIFGGIDFINENVFNDIYCLDTVTQVWTQIEAQGSPPSPRNSHTATMISKKKMLVYGGSSPDDGPMEDMWTLTFTDPSLPCIEATWSKVEPSNSVDKPAIGPGAREMHMAYTYPIYDANEASEVVDSIVSAAVIISGGRKVDGSVCSDVWMLDTASWTWSLMGHLADSRCAHGAMILQSSSKDPSSSPSLLYCIYAGFNGVDRIFGDLQYCLVDAAKKGELGEWRSARLSREGKDIILDERFGHACCPTHQGFFVFGGVNIQQDFSDMWQVQLK